MAVCAIRCGSTIIYQQTAEKSSKLRGTKQMQMQSILEDRQQWPQVGPFCRTQWKHFPAIRSLPCFLWSCAGVAGAYEALHNQ